MTIWLAYTSGGAGADDPFASMLPVGLLTINAILRKAGYRSRLVNLSGLSRKQILALLLTDQPSLIGFSLLTHNRIETLELASCVKRQLPGTVVVLGGPHATHRWQQILDSSPQIDAIVAGEGEITMLELVRAVDNGPGALTGIQGLAVRQADGKAILGALRPQLANLDELPLSAHYVDDTVGVDLRHQLEFIITSRGCPSACRFCSSPRFWGSSLRFRSPQSIIDEIRYLRDHYGLIYFSFRDDTFTADRDRVIDFCRLIQAERIFILWNCQSRVNAVDPEMLQWMRRAGCECIQFGIESGAERVLKTLGKRINTAETVTASEMVRQAGIQLSVYLIAGVFEDEDADLTATADLMEKIRPVDGQVSPLVYFPGTPLFEAAVKQGKVPHDLYERLPDAAFPVMPSKVAEKSMKKLLLLLDKSTGRSDFSVKEFKQQKTLLGYCHATNLQAGKYYESHGEHVPAEREYREIINREPDNPWGWLALGELFAETGRISQARHAFEELCRLVPAHAPGYETLAQLSLLSGDRKGAQALQRTARKLLRGG